MSQLAHIRSGHSRIAVVGGGISGLTAALRLGREHDVTLFEAEPRLGGHSSTVYADTPEGAQPVDTGFIVFNDRNYPNFTELLEQIDAPTAASNMSFGVSDERGDFEFAGSSPNALFAKRSHLVQPGFYRMVSDLVRFNRAAQRLVRGRNLPDVSLCDFLEDGRYSQQFIERLIVPQVSAVWSADPDQLYEFPARIVFEFFDNHGILELTGRPKWQTIRGGSVEYVRRLRAAIRGEVISDMPVEAVRRGEDGVAVKLADGAEAVFDEIVFATHSDQALKLLTDPTQSEREILGAIPYQDNDVVLHTDRSLMPRRRAAWASWNYHLRDAPGGRSTVSYWMNNLQPIPGPTDYFVTLNLTDRIDPSKIISEQRFAHPVFTREGLAAQERHAEISGVNRTHYCGAYWRWGFHEDGVWSAIRVADAMAPGRAPTTPHTDPDDFLVAA